MWTVKWAAGADEMSLDDFPQTTEFASERLRLGIALWLEELSPWDGVFAMWK
jgi:hypothetical protein